MEVLRIQRQRFYYETVLEDKTSIMSVLTSHFASIDVEGKVNCESAEYLRSLDEPIVETVIFIFSMAYSKSVRSASFFMTAKKKKVVDFIILAGKGCRWLLPLYFVKSILEKML